MLINSGFIMNEQDSILCEGCRKKLSDLTKQGLENARLRGVVLGRPKVKTPVIVPNVDAEVKPDSEGILTSNSNFNPPLN